MADRDTVSVNDKRYLGRRRMYKILKNNAGEKLISDIHMCDYRKYHGCEWAYAYTSTYTVYAISSGFGARVRVQLLDDDYRIVKEMLLGGDYNVCEQIYFQSGETLPTLSADSQ